MTKKFSIDDWMPPDEWRRIVTVDTHTGGEPLRVILDGYPVLSGNTLLERRRFAKKNHDDLRKALMWEPRGHADMYGCVITESVSPDADFGVIFMHNEGYSTMCGHGIIAVVTVALETGFLPMQAPETEIKIDTPAGFISARATIQHHNVTRVSFLNVPSYVLALDEIISIPGLGRGKIRYDLAFGGAFYAYVEAADLGLSCNPEDLESLIRFGKIIKSEVSRVADIRHPVENDMSFLYGIIFTGPAADAKSHSRNVCIFAEGEVDRSPTGTGVSGRMAIRYARNQSKINEPFIVESILGSTFTGKIIQETTFGPHKAIIPEISGCAHIVGRQEFFIDPDDPLKTGFIFR